MWRQREPRVRLPLPRKHPAMCATSRPDRKSTRLNSSHGYISYVVFCLKKEKFSAKLPVPQDDGRSSRVYDWQTFQGHVTSGYEFRATIALGLFGSDRRDFP